MATTTPTPTPRTRLACIACTCRKVKCSSRETGVVPCTNCARRGEQGGCGTSIGQDTLPSARPRVLPGVPLGVNSSSRDLELEFPRRRVSDLENGVSPQLPDLDEHTSRDFGQNEAIEPSHPAPASHLDRTESASTETGHDLVVQDAVSILEFLAWGRRKDPKLPSIAPPELEHNDNHEPGSNIFKDCSSLAVLQLWLPGKVQVQQPVDYHCNALLWYHGSCPIWDFTVSAQKRREARRKRKLVDEYGHNCAVRTVSGSPSLKATLLTLSIRPPNPPLNCHDGGLVSLPPSTPTITSYCRFLYDIAAIMPQLQDGLMSCNTSYTIYAQILEWDAQLRALAINKRPNFLSAVPLEQYWPDWIPWGRRALAISSSHKIIMIHRSFLSASFTNPAFAFTRRTCLAASKTIVKEYKLVVQEDGPVLWIHQAIVVAAGIILSLDILHKGRDLTSSWNNAKWWRPC